MHTLGSATVPAIPNLFTAPQAELPSRLHCFVFQAGQHYEASIRLLSLILVTVLFLERGCRRGHARSAAAHLADAEERASGSEVLQ